MSTAHRPGWVAPARGERPVNALDRIRYFLIRKLAGTDAILLNVGGDREGDNVIRLRGNQGCYVGRSREVVVQIEDHKPVWWLEGKS